VRAFECGDVPNRSRRSRSASRRKPRRKPAGGDRPPALASCGRRWKTWLKCRFQLRWGHAAFSSLCNCCVSPGLVSTARSRWRSAPRAKLCPVPRAGYPDSSAVETNGWRPSNHTWHWLLSPKSDRRVLEPQTSPAVQCEPPASAVRPGSIRHGGTTTRRDDRAADTGCCGYGMKASGYMLRNPYVQS